ncbi:GNAT family N-acetyltransferase [Pseudomonas sp. MF6751]|uniref:GNAT family N-acetyltransferase n=1 Tax=Pseudomonas TaxID=286 RepID=UPI0018E5F98E|nr:MULTISPECIES: GNAT family N-acetyltransferase [Pseudomonas]MBI6655970.1 GNAT family N-acetyltransferase [Pseudomonas carnis]MBI6663158.1 GNAT family N-acetyltransferase [Pseudomonas carnis]MBI6687209.1 GNAT family N-acetyltransferase [Pseudomonas carnis]MBK3478602.1 GNAT family N-acetyltransferase [Pseudomonas sp. MF6751]
MLEIKRATPDDAERAFEIRREAIRGQCIGAYSAEQMALWTRGRASDGYSVLMEKQFYMGWLNDEPVVTGMLDLADGEIGALFVLPAYMGQGLGKAMLAHLEGVARQHAIEQVVLDATLNAVSFYRACGYVGDEQAVYRSPSGLVLACVPMVKRLRVTSPA